MKDCHYLSMPRLHGTPVVLIGVPLRLVEK